MCLWQASGLEHIKTQLRRQSITDIQFIVINSPLQHAIDNVGELARRVSFPLYQDTDRSNIWRSLNGHKDDILIYDRCGFLTEHIPYPQSMLNRRNFQNALWLAYFSNPCDCTPSEQTGSNQNSQHSETHSGHNGQGQGHNHGRSHHDHEHGGTGRRQHHDHSHHNHGNSQHNHQQQQDRRRSRRHIRQLLFGL